MSSKNDTLSRRFVWVLVFFCIVLITLTIWGLKSFSNRKPDIIPQEVDGGVVELHHTSEVSSFGIMDCKKLSDAEGEIMSGAEEFYDFTVDVNLIDDFKVEYEISIEKDKMFSNIPDDDIRIYLEKEESGTYTRVFGPEPFSILTQKSEVGSPAGSMVIASASKARSGEDHYRLRMWLANESSLETGSYSVAINIHAVTK